jgi:hypothetical protein
MSKPKILPLDRSSPEMPLVGSALLAMIKVCVPMEKFTT